MHERHWEELQGREIRYRDRTWALSGDVEILRDGALIGADARQVDGSRHDTAQLFFAVENPPRSVNPGAFGEYDLELIGDDGGTSLVVSSSRRRYQYNLQRLEWD